MKPYLSNNKTRTLHWQFIRAIFMFWKCWRNILGQFKCHIYRPTRILLETTPYLPVAVHHHNPSMMIIRLTIEYQQHRPTSRAGQRGNWVTFVRVKVSENSEGKYTPTIHWFYSSKYILACCSRQSQTFMTCLSARTCQRPEILFGYAQNTWSCQSN